MVKTTWLWKTARIFLRMSQKPYPFKRFWDEYEFVSIGKSEIVKSVEFIPFDVPNTFNLCLGDVMPDGSIDDRANSNNGDLPRVLSTVVEIITNFTADLPSARVIFGGNNAIRTALYRRILKNNYELLSATYKITGVIINDDAMEEEEPFDPLSEKEYVYFVVERKNLNLQYDN